MAFGLLAALLFALSASMQQHAARAEAGTVHHGRQGHPSGSSILVAIVRLVRRLIRNRLWLMGWGTNLTGFMSQAIALHFGSVALVQPLLVAQLLFALPLASSRRRQWPTTRDWASAWAICAGLVIFLVVKGIAPAADVPNRPRVILAGLSAAVLIAMLVSVAGRYSPAVRGTLLAVCAGLCFAMTAVLIKLTLQDLVQSGAAATAADWPGYCLALSTLCGLLLEQGAFGAGTLPGAVAAMTITNPLASYIIGMLALNTVPPTSPGALAALTGAGALLCLGSVGLAHSPEVRAEIGDTGQTTPSVSRDGDR